MTNEEYIRSTLNDTKKLAILVSAISNNKAAMKLLGLNTAETNTEWCKPGEVGCTQYGNMRSDWNETWCDNCIYNWLKQERDNQG